MPIVKNRIWLVAFVLLVSPFAPATAQEQPAADSIPLRVQVVLSRYDGEKRLSNLPYTMLVNATRDFRQTPTSLRMGVDVPIPSVGKDGPTFSYRSVGTNIDCSAQIMVDGRFRLILGIEQSSIYPDDAKKAAAIAPTGAVTLRSFKTSFAAALKDGQTAQNTSATDPVSGEVLKVDITMNVVK